MADVRVTCVNKPHRMSPHEHITQLEVQMRSKFKATLELQTQFISSAQNPISLVQPVGELRRIIGAYCSMMASRSHALHAAIHLLSRSASALFVHDGLLCFDLPLLSVRQPARSGVASRKAQLDHTLAV